MSMLYTFRQCSYTNAIVSILSQRSATKTISLPVTCMRTATTFIVSFSTADVSSHLGSNCAPGASHSERYHFPIMFHTI